MRPHTAIRHFPRQLSGSTAAFLGRVLALLLVLTWATPAVAQGLFSSADEEFLPPDQAFQLSAIENDGRVKLRWEIAPGYYLYRKRLGVDFPDGKPLPLELPKGEIITDEYFGESEVYYNALDVTATPGEAEFLSLTWQGCAENGLCYAPQKADLRLVDMEVLSPGSIGTDTDGGNGTKRVPEAATDSAATKASIIPPAQATSGLGEDQALAVLLGEATTGWTLAAFFGMGLLLVFTPCVLPMVPILSSLVVGSNAGARRGLLLSLVFVVPMALTYALLGVAAALAGANLQAVLQTPWVLGVFAALFAVFALSMFGLFELQLPSSLRQRLDRLQHKQRGGTLSSAAVMGVLSALLVGPCMTAPLAGALLYIGESGDALFGGAALLALGLGMGTPLLLVGAFGARLLPRPGPWMNRIKAVFGFILLGMAIYFLDRVINDTYTLGLWGVWLLGAAVALYYASRAKSPSSGHLISRSGSLILGLWGALLIIGSAGGATDPLRPLSFLQASNTTAVSSENFMARFSLPKDLADLERRVDSASRAGRWTLVDFYAEWCVSCKVIENEVFGDPRVQIALAEFQLLRPDVTDNDATNQTLMDEFDIVGPPTLLLIGPDGQERRAQRIVGEISADAFLERLQRAGAGS